MESGNPPVDGEGEIAGGLLGLLGPRREGLRGIDEVAGERGWGRGRYRNRAIRRVKDHEADEKRRK